MKLEIRVYSLAATGDRRPIAPEYQVFRVLATHRELAKNYCLGIL